MPDIAPGGPLAQRIVDAPTELQQAVSDLRLLAAEIAGHDAAVAQMLERLADAVHEQRLDEARAYSAALEPRAMAEILVDSPSWLWGVLEVARNVLIFTPIAVTWYGLSTASTAYAELLAREPKLSDRPFLLLWQQGFEGARSVINFSTLATIDAALIGVLIITSLAIHVRTDLRGAALRSRVLLRESQIRGLVGHALSLAAAAETGGGGDILDQMVAEERRIYERAFEREQQLFDLEGAIGELRRAAADLARAAEALRVRPDEAVPSAPRGTSDR